MPGEQHKSAIRSFGDNDFVVEDKEGDKHILLKQACGNEIRMHETTPDIEIKQECGNEILMKASGADIEIKQACGNEILMHEAEGIQIRDSYGNEIVLDSAAGTMKMRSPSHESYIELGKSIWAGTLSDAKEQIEGNQVSNVNGNFFQVVNGTFDTAVLGPFKAKWDGVNILFHGGAVSDVFGGIKHTCVIGAKIDTSRARDFTKVNGKVRIDSQVQTEVIGGGGDADTSKLFLGGEDVSLLCGTSGIRIHQDGDIEIFSDKKVSVGTAIIKDEDAGTIKLYNQFKMSKDSKTIEFTGGTNLKHKNISIDN